MPAASKATVRQSKPTASRSSVATARTRAHENDRQLDQVMKSLEAAQKDLASIGGNLGAGARDLRRNVTRLLRDARRDALKMRRAMQRDVLRLQKDLGAAAMPKQSSKARSSRTTPRPRTVRSNRGARTRAA